MNSRSDIFLSYSREDQAVARLFADGLQQEGFTVWWDQALNAGDSFDKVTEQALREAKATVVLWSKTSVDSRWVRSEATLADRFGTLVPVMIEPCDRPIMFELTHTADLSTWRGDRTDPRWKAFVAGLRRSPGETSSVRAISPAAAKVSASDSAAGRTKGNRRFLFAGMAAALLAVAAVGWYWSSRGPATISARNTASIAVLPFRDMSPGQDQGYFADGVSEEILNSLAGIQNLVVTARTSSFAYKGKDVDLRIVGRELGVQNVLEGSIRKDGDKLRITAQLIDAGSGAHKWSKTYNRPLNDVFKVQEEVAAAVAQALEVSLGVGESARVPGITRDVKAFDAVLEGVEKSSSTTLEGVQEAADLFRRAVAIDPGYADAWSRLSALYLRAEAFLPNPPGQTWAQQADAAFAEAQRIAPNAYYTLLGQMERSMRRGEWAEAEKLLEEAGRRAGEQGVNFGMDARKGLFYSVVGRPREAIERLERWTKRNPLDPLHAWLLGEVYAQAGELDRSLAELDRGMQLASGEGRLRHLGTGVLTALAMRRRDVIERRVDMLVEVVNADPASMNRVMRERLDTPGVALQELRRRAAEAGDPLADTLIGAWSVYFGDPQLAMETLRSLKKGRNYYDVQRLWRPIMADVRKLPGFRQIVTDLGLVDYWRANGWPSPFCQPVGDSDFQCH